MSSIKKFLSACAITAIPAALAITGTPAWATPPPPPPPPVSLNNCTGSLTLPTPDAVSCYGYYSGNVLNGSSEDVTAQNTALVALGFTTWNQNWAALENSISPDLVITSLSGGSNNQLNFGETLFGTVIIGAHFGNITDPFANPDNNGQTGNVSVFWLFNLTTPTNFITLDNVQGFSNAALYQNDPPPGVPEPATWAMMLLGFGAAGVVMRRSRRKTQLVSQLA